MRVDSTLRKSQRWIKHLTKNAAQGLVILDLVNSDTRKTHLSANGTRPLIIIHFLVRRLRFPPRVVAMDVSTVDVHMWNGMHVDLLKKNPRGSMKLSAEEKFFVSFQL